MVKFLFKTLVFVTQDLGILKQDLAEEMDRKINEYGSQGYDIDSMSNEGDFFIIIMKREIRPASKKRRKKKVGTQLPDGS